MTDTTGASSQPTAPLPPDNRHRPLTLARVLAACFIRPLPGTDHATRRYAWCRPPRIGRPSTRPVCTGSACDDGSGAGTCCAMP